MLNRRLVPEIAMAYRSQSVVKLVHQRYPRWDIEVNDIVVGYAIEVLDEGTETVAVCYDKYSLSRSDIWCKRPLPVWNEPGYSSFERLR